MHQKSVGNELLTNVEIIMSIHHSQNDCSFHDICSPQEIVQQKKWSSTNYIYHVLVSCWLMKKLSTSRKSLHLQICTCARNWKKNELEVFTSKQGCDMQ